MRISRFLPIAAVAMAVSMMPGCKDKPESPGPAPSVNVTTGTASITGFATATLHGSYANANTEVTVTGFTYGTTASMENSVTAQADGNGNFSASLEGLQGGTTYFYAAVVTAGGKQFKGSPAAFSTTPVDNIKGKQWIELPGYTVPAGRVAKAYYATMKDGKPGRNYSILYDMTEHLSLWVAFPMHRNLHLGTGRDEAWQYDNSGDIPTSVQPNVISGTYGTYATDNMDRGHQIANADRNGSRSACDQTYMMTNMTPQHKWLNQGKWEGLESAIRSVANNAATLDRDTLYIVTGPLLNSPNPVYIKDKSNKECRIPDGYFKVVLWSKYNGEGTARSYDTIGFVWPENYAEDSRNKDQFVNFQKPVTDVEQQTGFSFFANLGVSADEMARIKSTPTWASFSNRSTNP